MVDLAIPAGMVPSYNRERAVKKGVHKKFLFSTWGGLGDQACAEPVIRYAKKQFKDRDFYLVSEAADLFSHIGFKEIIPVQKFKDDPNLQDQFFTANTIVPPTDLAWEFFSHMLTHPVDFASQLAFGLSLPIADKNIILEHGLDSDPFPGIDWNKCAVIHAGRHWPSKTFPPEFWNGVITQLLVCGITPVLIGKDVNDNRGTVDVDSFGCIDLRNKTSLKQMIFILQKTKCLISNDSSPIHIAASGQAHIGFIASCKHPDYISHWRKNEKGVNEWAWRMKNLSLDGAWNHVDFNPVSENEEGISIETLPESLMRKLLPRPFDVAMWARGVFE